MPKIAFIAPGKEIYDFGRKTIKELGFKDVELYLALLNKGVDIAKKLEAQGVDVIVSRGGTAALIEANVKTPVVEIPISGQDLAYVLYEAKRITGLKWPKVAVLAFDNMIYDIEILSRVIDIDLKIYRIKCFDRDKQKEEIRNKVEMLFNDKPDIVVGGIYTIKYASKVGFKTLFLSSREASFRSALLEAQKVAYGRQIEKEITQRYKILVNYSIDGIIGIDSNEKINVFNKSAEKLLGIQTEKAIGKDINTIIPQLNVDAILKEKKEQLGEIINLNGANFMTNTASINVNNNSIGAIITFQDVTKIQEMESKIRKKFYSKGLVAKYKFDDILGVSEEILEAKRIAKEFARINETILITGASGTGKELFAQSIHNYSLRNNGPFVAINCASLPSNLLESELFGYVEGAFTGASKNGKIGLFELAHGGTIFLDEISEMDLNAQSRLLRVIQERQVMRLGDDKVIPIDVRIIAATNKDLFKQVSDGKFREDLYYRLNILTLTLPALCERKLDIPFLINHFLKIYNKMFDKQVKIEDDAMALLESYRWPGNVRELKNVVERLVVIAKCNTIDSSVVKHVLENKIFAINEKNNLCDNTLDGSLSEKEKLITILCKTNFNIKDAASLLGVNRSTLYRKLKKYDIKVRKSCNI